MKEKEQYFPTEDQLELWGKRIEEALLGFCKDDIEPLFERYVLPIYMFSARRPDQKSDWKIIKRNTGEVYTEDKAISELTKLGIIKR